MAEIKDKAPDWINKPQTTTTIAKNPKSKANPESLLEFCIGKLKLMSPDVNMVMNKAAPIISPTASSGWEPNDDKAENISLAPLAKATKVTPATASFKP